MKFGYFLSSSLTTELVLELQAELVNEIERLHQEDVVLEGRGRHGPERRHIGSGHPDGVDLDAFLSRLSCHLRHAVLRASVCHDHSHIRNLGRGEYSSGKVRRAAVQLLKILSVGLGCGAF